MFTPPSTSRLITRSLRTVLDSSLFFYILSGQKTNTPDCGPPPEATQDDVSQAIFLYYDLHLSTHCTVCSSLHSFPHVFVPPPTSAEHLPQLALCSGWDAISESYQPRAERPGNRVTVVWTSAKVLNRYRQEKDTRTSLCTPRVMPFVHFLWKRSHKTLSQSFNWLACMCACSVVSDSAIPWTVACQAPLSMGFSRQENWNGLPFPSPGDLTHSGIEPVFPASPAMQAHSFTTEPLRNPILIGLFIFLCLSCNSYLYILNTSSLSDIWFTNTVSHCVGCLFTLLIVLFAAQKFWVLM